MRKAPTEPPKRDHVRGTAARARNDDRNYQRDHVGGTTPEAEGVPKRGQSPRARASIEKDRIETLCSEEGDIEAQEAERESFEDTFYRLSAKGKLLAKIDDESIPNDHSPQAPQQQPLGESIKYPEISLPSFDGDLTQWLQFRDTFDALVNQASLASIVKYKYLRSCLRDGALEVISSLDFSEEAYTLAWQMLCERYNNPKRLVSNHMRALFDVEPVPSTPSGLRGLQNLPKEPS
ncbi:uncharacterized protein LOC134653729 [Cydia amplana]|uniref:uncharacterized protein LOC134653729 n=1 Tax=Cydia amplana TaxID=1869771 RepID=UPI002FE690A2